MTASNRNRVRVLVSTQPVDSLGGFTRGGTGRPDRTWRSDNRHGRRSCRLQSCTAPPFAEMAVRRAAALSGRDIV